MARAERPGDTPATDVASPALAAALAVEVAYSPAPRQVDVVTLQLPQGATVGDALQASGLLQRHGLQLHALRVGVWGRQQALDHPLRTQDRVEIYRPLRVDPKEARRLRYSQHRERAAAAAARKQARSRPVAPPAEPATAPLAEGLPGAQGR